MADITEQRARVVLHTANRTQAKGSTVRLVVPRAPEVAYDLEPLLSEAELLAAEEYLLERGYLAPAKIGLRWGTYTITPEGFSWLEGDLPESTERLRELAEKPGEEVAFEAAVQSELEEERHRMEGLKRELEVVPQKLPGAPEKVETEPEKAESRLTSGNFQTSSEQRPWWRRMFGG